MNKQTDPRPAGPPPKKPTPGPPPAASPGTEAAAGTKAATAARGGTTAATGTKAGPRAAAGTATGARPTNSSARRAAQRQATRAPGGPDGHRRGAGGRGRAPVGRWRAADQAATVLDWGVAAGVFLLCVGVLPKVVSIFSSHSAVMLVLGAAGLPALAVRARGGEAARSAAETWAARCAVALIAVTFLSALLSPGVVVGIFGTYQFPSGWVFIVALAGCWALGSAVSPRGRRLLENAVIAGAVVNAAVCVIQQFVNLGGIGFGDYNGLPDGLQGNPVFLGALLAGALALVAPRFVSAPKDWWHVTALFCLALGVAGERFPAVLAVAVVVWTFFVLWRGRSEVAAGGRWWLPGSLFGAAVIGALVVGSVVTRLSGGVGVVSHVAQSTGTETYGQRLQAWEAGLHAFASRPVLGVGPGQFLDATTARYSLHGVQVLNDGYFNDAHDIFVQFLTTTGVLGLGALLAFLWLAARSRSGPLLVCAVILVASELVEPLNACITPLIFLTLGAASLSASQRHPVARTVGRSRAPTEPDDGSARARPLPRWVFPAGAAAAALALIPAVMLVVGDVAYTTGTTQIGSLELANAVLPWPQPALGIAQQYSQQEGGTAEAIQWARAALARDPTNATLWALLAEYQVKAGEIPEAGRTAATALRYNPYELGALFIEGGVATTRAQAEHYLELSLAVDPGQPKVRKILDEFERGCAVDRRHQFVCPTS